jgi:phosphotransferase system HPr-like phosphotransfer protein
MQENAAKFNGFMVTKLSEEIKELRNDRKAQMENQQKLEKFVVHALAKEIREFSTDKKAVVEARVKLVTEGRQKLEALKQKFVAESAKRVSDAISSHLKGELSQLKEDIKTARENSFGRKLFEAFASEYSVTYLNDKAEARKLMSVITAKDQALAEATGKSKDREVRIIKESTQREKEMEKLLSPLNKEKADVMKALLESVQTPKLKSAFDKYLPAVLNTGIEKSGAKTALTESVVKEVTGDKETAKKKIEEDPSVENNLIDFKRLAGLK